MEAFCSLFDPSDGNNAKTTKKVPNEQNTVKKKNETKGRRGRRRSGKPEPLPEESSFLCMSEERGADVALRQASYIDSYIRRDESPCEADRRSRRRAAARKLRRRRSKTSPAEPREETLLNNRATPPRPSEHSLGKNVNDISSHQALEQLETMALSDGSDSDFDDHGTSTWAGGRLPAEPRFGNVEYKLQLVQPSDARLQHLVTQLKWRLASGGGYAIYVVGVRDCGYIRGLSPARLRASLATLRTMAAALRASVAHVCVRTVGDNAAVAEVHVKLLAETQQSVELRIAVMGANEAGKSTLVGVLTQGELDNGQGSARLNMFRHLHEVRSGRTSSLSHEILGFDAQGKVVNYGCSELMTAERIGERSAKLVCFLDLAGHTKYQRTTLHGLSAYCPHAAMLLKPLLISDEKVLSRVVVAPQKLLLDDLDEQTDDDASAAARGGVVPVFPVSCVRGSGLSALHAYLLALQPPPPDTTHLQDSCEFQIDEIFHVSARGEAVVGGFLASGLLREGDDMLLGPLEDGSFVSCAVVCIHIHRVRCARAAAGHSASLLLRTSVPPRPGMALLSKKEPPETVKSESAPGNRKTTRRKSTNLLQDIKNAENSLTKHSIDNINIYNSNNDDEKPHNSKPERKKINNANEVDSDSDEVDTFADELDSDTLEVESDKEVESNKNEVKNTVSDEAVAEDPYNPRGCIYFQATVEVLQHPTAISAGFQCTVHVGNVRQTAVIEGVLSQGAGVRAGQKASCVFRLTRCPEYLVRGRRLLLTAGHGARAIGRITQVFPYTP